MESFGWPSVFYTTAGLTLLTALVWYWLVSNTPAAHPRISAAEREYIEASLGSVVSKEKLRPPFFRIMTSLPFLVLLLLHYGNIWGLYFLLNEAPTFMKDILKFDLKQAGFLASLPSLARLVLGFGFGSLGDFLRRRKLMDLTLMRKCFCLFCEFLAQLGPKGYFILAFAAHVVPGLLLISISYIGDYPYICVAIITASLGSNGASTITNLQNSQDLAPNFAGLLYSIINCVSTSSGYISPLLVSYITQTGVRYRRTEHSLSSLLCFSALSITQNTIAEWSTIFTIGGALYIAPAVLYAIFGTAQVQSWNEPAAKAKDTEH